MSRGKTQLDRAAVIAALSDEVGRKSSTATILYQQAIAERMGVGLTDLVCGEILSRTGAITAGELADLSGLTTGAITGVVDRLEKAGLVRRVNDPNDRRRVMLEPVPARFDHVSGNPYEALEKRFNELYADYSDDELAVLLDFLRKSITIFDEESMRLRSKGAPRAQGEREPRVTVDIKARVEPRVRVRAEMQARAEGEALLQIHRGRHREERIFSAPRNELDSARLEWVSGPVSLELRGAKGMSELYRAQFQHDIPIVRDQEGIVSVQYRHRTLFGRGGGRAEVELNTQTAWDMDLECGPSDIEADLREISLRGIALRSGISKLTFLLPPPSGTVRVRLETGQSHIRIERPKNVPVRLVIEGDWSKLHFDRQRVNVSTETRESPEYKRATDRYLIELIGGGSKLVVEEGGER